MSHTWHEETLHNSIWYEVQESVSKKTQHTIEDNLYYQKIDDQIDFELKTEIWENIHTETANISMSFYRDIFAHAKEQIHNIEYE